MPSEIIYLKEVFPDKKVINEIVTGSEILYLLISDFKI